MGQDHVLDLGRIDLPSGHDDHVLFPVGDVQDSAGIQVADITGKEPSVREEGFGCGPGHPPVSLRHRGSPERNLSVLPGPEKYGRVGRVHDLDFRVADRDSHTPVVTPEAGDPGKGDGAGADNNRFREAVGVGHRDPVAPVECLPDGGEELAAPADDGPDRGKILLCSVRSTDEGMNHRRHGRKDGDLIAAAPFQVFGEGEPLHGDIGSAGPQHGKPPAHADMPHGVDAEIAVPGCEREHLAFGLQGRDPVPVGEHCALGTPGRPGSVLELAEIIAAAVLGRE